MQGKTYVPDTRDMRERASNPKCLHESNTDMTMRQRPGNIDSSIGSPSPRDYDYDCDGCDWSGNNPKVLIGLSEDKLCPDCGSTIER
jgi:hypothetical protein